MSTQRAASGLTVRWTGACNALTSADRRALFDRTAGIDATVGERTSSIVARVRQDGDEALRALAVELDGVELDALEVPRARWQTALEQLPRPLRQALERSARNIERVHRACLPVAQET